MSRAGCLVESPERLSLSPAIVPIAFGLFAMLGVASRAGLTHKTDLRVRRKVGPKKNKAIKGVATAVSVLGAPHARPVLAAGVAACCYAVGVGRPSRIIAAALCSTALNKTTRMVFHQRRPPGAGIHHGLDVYAYPSGHSCAVAAIMTAAFREAACGESARVRNGVAVAGVVASLATAWSRLYLDEHWIDDVVGGLAAGVGIGLSVTDA